jgi:hypothetical protein
MVLRLKPKTCRGDFEAQINNPELSVLSPKPKNPAPPWFWGSTKKPTTGFEAKPGETIATSFDAKLEKTVATGFEAKPAKTVAASFEAKLAKTVATGFEPKPPETVATGFDAKPAKTVATGFEAKPSETVATDFEAKPAKIVQVVLRPNHSQTVDLGFEAQSRNPRSSSSRARCRPHTAPPNLLIARPPSTRPMRPSPVLYTRSPTPATILVITRHPAPATCTPRDKQT